MQYDRIKRTYRDASGRPVSRRDIKVLIDKLTERVTKETGKFAAKFDAGELTAAEFNLEMRAILKSAHIIASSVGRGGIAQKDASDWGRVGRKIQWQYKYLDRFTRKLEQGALSKANSVNRAKSYVSSVYISFADAFMEAQVERMEPETGKVITDENMLCRLVTNSEEGCSECAADEAEGWMPVADMGELGSRICGDFCKCVLEFEDELNGEI